MTPAAAIQELKTQLETVMDCPVYAFDSNETREIPCVIVGIETHTPHPLLANAELGIFISLCENGHEPFTFGNPLSIDVSVFCDGVTYTGTTTESGDTSTINTIHLTLYI